MSFSKDALIHKLQDKLDKKEEKMNRIEIIEILYSFIEFYTVREIDRLDMRILADRFIDEELGRDE